MERCEDVEGGGRCVQEVTRRCDGPVNVLFVARCCSVV